MLTCAIESMRTILTSTMSADHSEEDLPRKRKQAKVLSTQQLSPEDTCLEALEFILNRSISLRSQDVGYDGKEIALRVDELPLDEKSAYKHLKELLASCTASEVDAIQYIVKCWYRAITSPKAHWDPQLWSILSTAAQDASAQLTLQQLVQGSVEAGDGLWTDLFGGESINQVASSFLELLSGWSDCGVELSTAMLQKVASLAKTTDAGSAFVTLVKTGGRKLRLSTRLDELLVKESQTLDALQKLFSSPLATEMLAAKLLDELKLECGSDFEKKSMFGDILSVTMVIDKLQLRTLTDKKYSCFLELRNFPHVTSGDIISCHSQLQDALHRCHKTVHLALLKMLKTPLKNIVLDWMAVIINHNHARAGPRFKGQRGALEGTCSDGWMINYCAVLLELCRPFFSSSVTGPKLALIDHSYPTSLKCRLELEKEPCLAGGIIGEAPQSTSSAARSSYKFVTELFFLTQRALHVGLLPALKQFMTTSSDLAKQLLMSNMAPPKLKELNSLHTLAGTTCLLDPHLVEACSHFYITQAVWLLKQLEDSSTDSPTPEQSQRETFKLIPEHGLKDSAVWFRFLVLSQPALLQGLPLTVFVDCCVGLLERPDLLPSPLAQGRLVSVLLACINSDQRGGAQRLLGAEGWGGILGELSVMVQASPSVRDKLGPALLHTYAAVSVVEGLDVDKENFDKFATRYEVAQLLMRLWLRDDCKASILSLCQTKRFQAFVIALLDTLLYQLGDALSRLTNVRRYESAKEGGVWASLSERERQEKEAFLTGEQRAAKGFMTQAALQLELLFTLTGVEKVSLSLLTEELARRTTATLLGFLETLCGPKSSELKVRDMDNYLFRPKTLVTQITTVLSIVEYPEYSESTMSKSVSILTSEDPNTGTKLTQLIHQVKSNQTMCTAIGESTADHEWQKTADLAEIDVDGMCELYVGALAGAKYESCELGDNHILADKLPPSLDPRSPKVRAILRDMKTLEESLPVHPDSAILVRQDEERMDLVRVLITGPTDTPYSRGCFVFDILYPGSYPTNPPLVFMTTTGGGTIRFNPNLYADGKVCLSLLGTWHGGDATEKWDPLRSNLLQVLLSIQGMILIPDPMFNEPGYEAIRGTSDGNTRSRQYNADIQVHTVRYAMLEQLRHPPKGFEDAIQVHFAIQQEAILKQLSGWLHESLTPEHEKRLRKAVDEFRTELDKQ